MLRWWFRQLRAAQQSRDLASALPLSEHEWHRCSFDSSRRRGIVRGNEAFDLRPSASWAADRECRWHFEEQTILTARCLSPKNRIPACRLAPRSGLEYDSCHVL